MAWLFGDSFDFYAAPADLVSGYWDGGNLGSGVSIGTGRFSGSRALTFGSFPGSTLYKNSGSNDATHHIVLAIQQTAAISGTTLGCYVSFYDGTTAQCSLVFRSDGAIVLTSGGPGGTTLDTYTGAVSAQNTWYAFEFEVVINNTTGSWAIRKNGNTSNDHSLGSLNTRGGTTNNYANRIQLADDQQIINQVIDDFLWFNTTGIAPNTWVGDIRAYQVMPNPNVAPVSAAFTGNVGIGPIGGPTTQSAFTANILNAYPFTTISGGSITQCIVYAQASATGHLTVAIYDATGTGGTPGNLVASGTPIDPIAVGANTISISATLAAATNYHLVFWSDTTYTMFTPSRFSLVRHYATVTYTGSFPSTFPTTGVTTQTAAPIQFQFPELANNAYCISETQEDGTSTYVGSSTVGAAEFYAMTPLASTPASILAVQTRGFIEKSDAGTRTGAVQLKSGSTTVAAPTLSLSTNFLWNTRTDTVDPNTSAAWTAAAINALNIGPTVIS